MQVRNLRERQLSSLASRVGNLSASIDQELLQWKVIPSTRCAGWHLRPCMLLHRLASSIVKARTGCGGQPDHTMLCSTSAVETARTIPSAPVTDRPQVPLPVRHHLLLTQSAFVISVWQACCAATNVHACGKTSHAICLICSLSPWPSMIRARGTGCPTENDDVQESPHEAAQVNMATIKEELEAITSRALQPAGATESSGLAEDPEVSEPLPDTDRTLSASPPRPEATARKGLGASTGRSTQGLIRSQVLSLAYWVSLAG